MVEMLNESIISLRLIFRIDPKISNLKSRPLTCQTTYLLNEYLYFPINLLYCKVFIKEDMIALRTSDPKRNAALLSLY